MSKVIKFNEEQKNELREAFEKALESFKSTDGTFSFSKQFGNLDRRATVLFSEMAWLKMQALINENNQEVGWYGLTKRGDDPEKDEYKIYDILVYPQIRTAADIDQDQDECNKWMMDLVKNRREAFLDMHMHGHSHVNMGVSPSTTDLAFYKTILAQQNDDMFYIFMIWNKRGEKTIKIYDLAKNVLFETADCTVLISNDGVGIEDFLTESKGLIRDYSYTSKASKTSPPIIYTKESKTEAKEILPEKNATEPNVTQLVLPGVTTNKKKRKGRRSKRNEYTNYSKRYSYGTYNGYYDLYDDDKDW